MQCLKLKKIEEQIYMFVQYASNEEMTLTPVWSLWIQLLMAVHGTISISIIVKWENLPANYAWGLMFPCLCLISSNRRCPASEIFFWA